MPRAGAGPLRYSAPVRTWWRGATRADRTAVVAACAFVLLLVAGFEVQKHRHGGPARPASANVPLLEPDLELATIQLGFRPDHVDPTIRRLASVLDILEADCPSDTRAGLARMTVRSIRELRRSGIAATPTQVLGVVVGAPDIGATDRCTRYFARYVAERRRAGGTTD